MQEDREQNFVFILRLKAHSRWCKRIVRKSWLLYWDWKLTAIDARGLWAELCPRMKAHMMVIYVLRDSSACVQAHVCIPRVSTLGFIGVLGLVHPTRGFGILDIELKIMW